MCACLCCSLLIARTGNMACTFWLSAMGTRLVCLRYRAGTRLYLSCWSPWIAIAGRRSCCTCDRFCASMRTYRRCSWFRFGECVCQFVLYAVSQFGRFDFGRVVTTLMCSEKMYQPLVASRVRGLPPQSQNVPRFFRAAISQFAAAASSTYKSCKNVSGISHFE